MRPDPSCFDSDKEMTNNSSHADEAVRLDGDSLRLEQVISVARGKRRAELGPAVREKVNKSRRIIEDWVSRGEIIYGVTTGFGSLQNEVIPRDKLEQLQENLLISHAAGVGDVVPEEIVRAMMLLRANALSKGFSGIRVEVIERLLEMLNKGVCPFVLDKGSVGSSGDLAPLSHMALAVIGRGEAFYQGQRLSGAEALRLADIQPVRLQAKEGLALNNGTQFMTAIGALALADGERLARTADIAGAMSLEAMKGKGAAFDDAVHQIRPYRGQIDCARNVRALTAGSTLIDCEDEDTEKKRQDPYSLRCMPQVHGASRQALSFVREMLEIEINSATDNPLILPDGVPADGTPEGVSISAGNFHGQPVAITMDFLALALAEMGNISERRVAKLMNKNENFGLEAFLIADAGLNSGMMIAQYAAAALVSENKVLIHPASGDSIPTSANQEDHNSMGNIAARQAREVLENVERVIAIELLCAAQALGLRESKGLSPGVGTGAAYRLIRRHVPQMTRDRELYLDIQKVLDLVRSDHLLDEVNGALLEAGGEALA